MSIRWLCTFLPRSGKDLYPHGEHHEKKDMPHVGFQLSSELLCCLIAPLPLDVEGTAKPKLSGVNG